MSADYSEFKAEIKTVDSQDSLSGGVTVLVTGSLSTKSTGKRNFVQSFFLAPQEKGYFVLNDVFRYLDDDVQTKSASSSNGVPEAPPVVQQAPEAVVEQPAPAPVPEVVREVTPPPAPENEATAQEVFDDEGPTGAEEEEHTGPVPVEDTTTPVIEEPESPMVQTTPMRDSHPAVQEPEPVGEAPKKSYASILRVFGAPLPPKVAQPVAERPAVSSTPAPAAATPTHDNQEDAAPAENEADGRSVYVKNLPMTITASELEAELKTFGSIKPNGVNVKSQKQGVCYAFVEFEEPTAAQGAIEASPVSIQGRSVYIEEKKPMGRAPRRSNDGRSDRPYRSDRNDRGEGARGRGSYSGRNPGRGAGQDTRERDGNRGGRGGVPSRGGYTSNNGSASANSGSERRSDGQRPPRRNPNGAAQPPRSNGPPAVAAV
ncbi:hypothetical protein M758_3G157700 [Ceratodon purpureus]|nr:hypothetical protein KC19_3G158100 [Ceratodon purpureus]KAG0623222.1 hypothetical protein M758_3G157700 [Ceratodon purpureus]